MALTRNTMHYDSTRDFSKSQGGQLISLYNNKLSFIFDDEHWLA